MLTQKPAEQKLAQTLPISNAPVVANGMAVATDSINLGCNKEKEITNVIIHNYSKQPVIYQYNNLPCVAPIVSNEEHQPWVCKIL